MDETRWWHIANTGTVAVLVVLLLLTEDDPARVVGGILTLVVFLAVWFVVGRRASRLHPVAVVILVVAVVAAGGVATGFSAILAVIQCVAYPLIWTHVRSTRWAIIGNVALSLSVAGGFLFSLGTSPQAMSQTAITCAVSLGFSLCLGLWFTRVYSLVSERDEAIAKMESAQALVNALGRDAGARDERERLSREIHDTIAQDLTGLVMTAQRGRRELNAGDTAAADAQLAILEDNARHALAETRALVASGAAAGVDAGLAEALTRLGERFERETGIAVTIVAEDSGAIDRDREVVLLRCAQEALANVRKHSEASGVLLTLSMLDGVVTLRLADDGIGFDTAAPTAGFGLAGMRERLALVQGSIHFVSEPGQGVELVVVVPAHASSTVAA
jgi:signal transduction histidine kinase